MIFLTVEYFRIIIIYAVETPEFLILLGRTKNQWTLTASSKDGDMDMDTNTQHGYDTMQRHRHVKCRTIHGQNTAKNILLIFHVKNMNILST